MFRRQDLVARAMRAVPRERFVLPEDIDRAQENNPLPIACGQTISQPSLVAHMTEQLGLGPTNRVLEIGTGSGYQTAILAELAGEVFSIERIPQLADEASRRLAELCYKNIHLRVGDGSRGWPEMAPFDAIIVTAVAEEIPSALFDQLKPGGRLVAPEGAPDGEQFLLRLEKLTDGSPRRTNLGPVRFVPLVQDD